jgi:hypothetical protein
VDTLHQIIQSPFKLPHLSSPMFISCNSISNCRKTFTFIIVPLEERPLSCSKYVHVEAV